MRRCLLSGLLLAASLASAPAAAQTSQFGTRGLGLPVRPYSAHALGMGGGYALFDPASGLNPAALGRLAGLQAGAVATSNWRTSRTTTGEGTGRDTRYPFIQAAGPVHTSELGVVRLVAGFSLAGYTDRNFSLVSTDSITVRDERLAVRDTLISLGGLSDLRLGVAWNASPGVTLGGGLHLVTGATRVRAVRVLSSPLYTPALEVAEVSYLSYGASAGIEAQVSSRLSLAAMARLDAASRVERDTTRVGSIELPLVLGAGLEWAAHARLRMAGHVVHRGWARADESIRDLGGLGARNTLEAAAGLEWASSSRAVTRWPVRLGAHYATLPFPVRPGGEGREVGISVGTGGLLGLGGRGSFNIAVARVWRSEGSDFREGAFLLTTGLSIRPTN